MFDAGSFKKTSYTRVNPEHPEPEVIAEAAAVIGSGGTVAFPTETVYGLGANGLDPVAVEKIYEAKGRPQRNPLILHVASTEQARQLAAAWPAAAERLIEQVLAGAADPDPAPGAGGAGYCHRRLAQRRPADAVTPGGVGSDQSVRSADCGAERQHLRTPQPDPGGARPGRPGRPD